MLLTNQTLVIFFLLSFINFSFLFETALYFYLIIHNKLSEESPNILFLVICSACEIMLAVISLIFTLNDITIIGLFLIYIILLALFLTSYLSIRILVRIYGKVSHLRDRRFIKYVFPFSLINNFRNKKYALTTKPRINFNLGPYQLSKEEINYISKGYVFLFIGQRHVPLQNSAIKLLIEGIKNGETANYACCSTPPYQIWNWFKQAGLSKNDLQPILIDAFNPSFGFDDEILKEANLDVERESCVIIPAKGIAGVHSASNTAWYKTRELLKKEDLKFRIPNRIVYDNLSALKSVSSPELITSFVVHTAAAERRYGMITIFVEYEDVDQQLLSILETVVDGILSFSVDPKDRSLMVEAKKMNGIDPKHIEGQKLWP